MKKKLMILMGCLLLSACALTQPVPLEGSSVEEIVAATLQAMTATAPTAAQVNGLPVSYNNISFSIPLELNASAIPSTSMDIEFPYINFSNGPMPEHVVFQLTNYPLEGDARIIVFKASDYAAYATPLQDEVNSLLAGQDATQPLPDALVQGQFYAQAKPVNFQNGHGVRYVTEVLTGFAPINNRDVFYFYQGVTNDGAYFVSAVLGIQASFLVADSYSNSPTPPNGVPFQWSSDWNDSQYQQYLSDVTQKLNSAPDEDFSPSLNRLDALVRSISISP